MISLLLILPALGMINDPMAQKFQVTFGIPMSLQILSEIKNLMLSENLVQYSCCTLYAMVWELYSCWNLWGLGDIGWSLPKYCPIPPQSCMWDFFIPIIEKVMLKSWGISQNFLSGVPPFPSLVSFNRLPKMLHCPILA